MAFVLSHQTTQHSSRGLVDPVPTFGQLGMILEIQKRAYQSIRAARCLDAGADTGRFSGRPGDSSSAHPASGIRTSENASSRHFGEYALPEPELPVLMAL